MVKCIETPTSPAFPLDGHINVLFSFISAEPTDRRLLNYINISHLTALTQHNIQCNAICNTYGEVIQITIKILLIIVI